MGMVLCPEPSWIPAAGVSLLAVGVSYAGALLIRKVNVVDAPDGERKTQSVAVSRLGGVAILATVFAMFALSVVISLFEFDSSRCYAPLGFHSAMFLSRTTLLVFPLFLILLFAIGLWDDFVQLSGGLKLVIMLAACATPLLAGRPLVSLTTPFGPVEAPYLIMAGSCLWLLVFTNATNFMDGVNGLATGCLAIMLLGLHTALLDPPFLHTGIGQTYNIGIFVTVGAIIGFLIHNLRGKLDVGDAGALGLGALFASLGLVSGVQVWTVATLALPFLIDVLMTLIWRTRHRRPWLKPHLDHAYQNLRLSGWSHIETAFLYWGLSTVCAVAAVIAAKAGGDGPFFVFWGLCLSGIVIWSVHRRGHPAQ